MERFVKACRLRRMKILVLLHLCVVNTAADCQKPQATEAIVLGQAALLLNSFPEGLTVTLECARGYNRISGSGGTMCNNGQWSEADLTCEENDCGQPKLQPNMRFNISKGTRFRAVVRVFCDKGYTLTGSSYKRCYATGWSGNAKCQIVTCDKPAPVTNGRSLWSSQERPNYGETIQYQCNEGYTLVGEEKITCTETGKYDSEPPECKELIVPVTEASTQSPPTDASTTTSAATSVSYSTQGGLRILETQSEGATASVPSTTSLQDLNRGTVDTYAHTAYVAVIVGFVCILLVTFIGLWVWKFLLSRKGSYDTREDLKPELTHFHNL